MSKNKNKTKNKEIERMVRSVLALNFSAEATANLLFAIAKTYLEGV